ncbi:hypothetical protein TNCV_2493991 [Trichonephila clavipes]|uniref:Uncharacterized protein n=1 Tax=Trichonephila clavipes TaxID=2585209 RepID=A0A8X6RQN8_TRICX|nr:hypothetical protein TNCV_2493991 [Trichonephila clavipes]
MFATSLERGTSRRKWFNLQSPSRYGGYDSRLVTEWSPNLEMGSEMSHQMRNGIWKWEIVNPVDPDQNNGGKMIKLLYCHQSWTKTKLPVRLINTRNEWRLVQGHETTPLWVKGDIRDVSSELYNEG